VHRTAAARPAKPARLIPVTSPSRFLIRDGPAAPHTPQASQDNQPLPKAACSSRFLIGANPKRLGGGSRRAKPSRSDARQGGLGAPPSRWTMKRQEAGGDPVNRDAGEPAPGAGRREAFCGAGHEPGLGLSRAKALPPSASSASIVRFRAYEEAGRSRQLLEPGWLGWSAPGDTGQRRALPDRLVRRRARCSGGWRRRPVWWVLTQALDRQAVMGRAGRDRRAASRGGG
jgi:hypothetical protein